MTTTPSSAPSEAPSKAAVPVAPTEGGVSVDAAAQEALEKTQKAEEALVSLRQEAAPKTPVAQSEVVPPPAAPVAVPSSAPPTPAAPVEEPKFAETIANYYAAATASGSNWISAGFSTLVYAITSGGGKFWDWIKNIFNKKKESVEATVKTTVEAASTKMQNFSENIKSLLSEFNLTETTDKKKNFFMVAVELGKEVQAKFGIPYKVVVAQACLESGFGQSGLTQRALNCFGYKTGSSKVPYITMETTEFRNGVEGKENANFRSYASLRDSFMDYGKLISTQYRKAFDYKDDPKRFLEEVIKAGYATDPDKNYVAKAERTIATYGLNLA
ncbi:MAG: glucosaminidase domain-containing protein [Candidatus Gracilibacteria bacterium]